MSSVIIHSSFGDLECKPFQINRDEDVKKLDTPDVADLPLPETEVSE